MPLHSRPPEELRSGPPITEVETGQVDTTAGLELEQARAADAAWRATRSTHVQRRLDLTRKVALLGRRWTHSASHRFRVIFRHYLLLNGLLQVFARAFGWSWLQPLIKQLGIILIVWMVVGLCIHVLGRLASRWTLHSARRDHVEVVDSGALSLIGPDPPPAQ